MQPVQRVTLDLATALRAHPEVPADLFVAVGAPVVQAVATDEHLAVALREQPQHRGDLLLALLRDRALRRVDGTLVGEHVAEHRRVVVDRLVQRRDHRSRAAQRSHGAQAQSRVLGYRLIRSVPSELRLGAPDGGELLTRPGRQPDHPRVRDSVADRMLDRPHRVRREPQPAAMIEAFDGAHETDRALLDQIRERNPVARVRPGHGTDEPQVALDQPLLRGEVTAFYAPREGAFLGSGEQPVHATAASARRWLVPPATTLSSPANAADGTSLRHSSSKPSVRSGSSLRACTPAGSGSGVVVSAITSFSATAAGTAGPGMPGAYSATTPNSASNSVTAASCTASSRCPVSAIGSPWKAIVASGPAPASRWRLPMSATHASDPISGVLRSGDA